MGAMKKLVLCALFFISVALCKGIINPQGKHTTVIETRCKRETEIDVRAREPKTKVPFCRKPTRLLIPINKRFSPINANPRNALLQRNNTSVVMKPKVLNTTENGVKQSEIVHNNDIKTTYNTGLDTIEPNEATQAINSTKTDNENNIEGKKNDTLKENNESLDLITTDKEIQNYEGKNIEPKDGKPIAMIPKIVAEANAKIENDKYINRVVVDPEISQVSTKNTTLASNPVQIVPSPFLDNFKVVPGIPIKRSRKPVIIKNKSKSREKNNSINSTLPKIDTSTETINNNKKVTEEDDKIVPVTVPLTILTDIGKMPIKLVPKVPLQITDLKPTSESAALIPQINTENKIKITIEKLVPDTSAQSPKTDPEEIVIVNNQYEELYETPTRQYTIPQAITSELRNAQNWNLNTMLHYSEKYDAPQTHNDNKPFSYDVRKNGDEYVINAYDNEDKRQYNNDYPYDTNLNNQDINGNKKYTKNDSPRCSQTYDSYIQPETQDFSKTVSIVNNNKNQDFPRRIWRSWKNNQICIRPKYGGTINTELYKGLGRYISNANAQSVPVYAANRIGPSVYENQNTSPYINSFQYKRYGY